MNKHPNTKEPVIPMGIVNHILLIVLRLLNVYFRLIFRSLDPLILKFVGPPTHVTKITYFSFPSMLKTQRVSFLVWLQKQLQHTYIRNAFPLYHADKPKKGAKFIDVVSVWRFEKDHFLHFPGQNQNKFSFANVYLPKENTFSI